MRERQNNDQHKHVTTGAPSTLLHRLFTSPRTRGLKYHFDGQAERFVQASLRETPMMFDHRVQYRLRISTSALKTGLLVHSFPHVGREP